MSRPKRSQWRQHQIEDQILALRHSGARLPDIAARLKADGTPMDESSISRAYTRAVARHMPAEIVAAEVVRALMVCDEQLLRCRQRLLQPHPKLGVKGEVVYEPTRPGVAPKALVDLDVESRIEAEISRIEERRARIAGTFAPTKHAIAVLKTEDLAPVLEEWKAKLSPAELEEARRRADAIDVVATNEHSELVPVS